MLIKKILPEALLITLLLPVVTALVDDELVDGVVAYRKPVSNQNKPTLYDIKDFTNTNERTVGPVLHLLKNLRHKNEPAPIYYITLKDLIETARRQQRDRKVGDKTDGGAIMESANNDKLTLRSLNDVLLSVQSYLKASLPNSELDINSTLNLKPTSSSVNDDDHEFHDPDYSYEDGENAEIKINDDENSDNHDKPHHTKKPKVKKPKKKKPRPSKSPRTKKPRTKRPKQTKKKTTRRSSLLSALG